MAVKLNLEMRHGRPRRECSDCQLCCKLLPMHVPTIDKRAGERCPHQRANVGCNIYPSRPMCCQVWNCRWLVNDDTADLRRPDRSRYVIDVMPDIVRLVPNDGSKPMEVQVVQVWVDPKYRDAHKDPALRAYLERRAEKDGMAAIIRFNEGEALILFAPHLTGGDWREHYMAAPTPGFKGLHARMVERIAEKLK